MSPVAILDDHFVFTWAQNYCQIVLSLTRPVLWPYINGWEAPSIQNRGCDLMDISQTTAIGAVEAQTEHRTQWFCRVSRQTLGILPNPYYILILTSCICDPMDISQNVRVRNFWVVWNKMILLYIGQRITSFGEFVLYPHAHN